MATLLEDFEVYIIAGGLATADGIDIYREAAPEAPNNCIILYEYAGTPGGKGCEAGVRSIQVVARDVTVTGAQTKANQLYGRLNKPLESITYLTAERWAIIEARQTPFKIGIDESKRYLYGFNLGVTTLPD